MVVVTTIKGRHKIYTSDESGGAIILAELVESLADDGMAAERVIYVNSSDKVIVAEVGR